jgi:hypothetical protein
VAASLRAPRDPRDGIRSEELAEAGAFQPALACQSLGAVKGFLGFDAQFRASIPQRLQPSLASDGSRLWSLDAKHDGLASNAHDAMIVCGWGIELVADQVIGRSLSPRFWVLHALSIRLTASAGPGRYAIADLPATPE